MTFIRVLRLNILSHDSHTQDGLRTQVGEVSDILEESLAMTVKAQFEFDVFISYSSKDKEWVRGELLLRIERTGLKAFIDFRDFTPAAWSVQEMTRAVTICRKTLLILTTNYLGSEWCEHERLILQTLSPANRDLRLLPLLKSECELPLNVRGITHIDFTDGADLELAWRQLLTALRKPPDPEPVAEPLLKKNELQEPPSLDQTEPRKLIVTEHKPEIILKPAAASGGPQKHLHWKSCELIPRGRILVAVAALTLVSVGIGSYVVWQQKLAPEEAGKQHATPEPQDGNSDQSDADDSPPAFDDEGRELSKGFTILDDVLPTLQSLKVMNDNVIEKGFGSNIPITPDGKKRRQLELDARQQFRKLELCPRDLYTENNSNQKLVDEINSAIDGDLDNHYGDRVFVFDKILQLAMSLDTQRKMHDRGIPRPMRETRSSTFLYKTLADLHAKQRVAAFVKLGPEDRYKQLTALPKRELYSTVQDIHDTDRQAFERDFLKPLSDMQLEEIAWAMIHEHPGGFGIGNRAEFHQSPKAFANKYFTSGAFSSRTALAGMIDDLDFRRRSADKPLDVQ